MRSSAVTKQVARTRSPEVNRAAVRLEELIRLTNGEALVVRAERPPPAGRAGREADDDTGRFAASLPCRWGSARARG
jgi:hypothetical protein